MLRIILSVTGVGLIALGIFGGSPLGSLFNQFNGKSDQTALSNTVQTDIAQVNTQQVEIAAATPVLSKPIIVPKTAVVSGVTTSGDVVSAEATTAVVNVAVAPGKVINSGSTGTPAAVDGQALEVSSNVAQNLSTVAAANAADSAAALKNVAALQLDPMARDQAKSTDRNAQVALAQDSLASSNDDNVISIPSAAIDIGDKNEELGQVMAVSTGQRGNEMLVVMKDKVNMRDGPSIGHPVVLTLEQGQELMEFKREGKWVHVGAYGTSGKIGWVHERLVGPTNN